jgi:hypothetical protein
METDYKYKEFSDFRKAHPKLCNILHTRGEIEILCLDMGWKLPKKRLPPGHWNIKENCINESKTRNDKNDFRINSSGAYEASFRNGWLEEICELNGWGFRKRKSAGYWDIKENCIKESKTRNDKNDFRINSSGAYEASFRNGWLEEICELNGWGITRGYWNIKENCIKESKKSSGKKNFRKNSGGAYDSAKRNGWLDEICELNKWKIQIQKPSGYWDIKENCIEESKTRNGRNEFNRKSPGAYLAARRNGWLEEIKKLNNW